MTGEKKAGTDRHQPQEQPRNTVDCMQGACGSHPAIGAKPVVLPDGIPAELKQYPQWVLWRYERDGQRWTKVPYSPRSGARASVTDPSTWGTFDEAVATCHAGEYDGIGFVLSKNDPYAIIDLDNKPEHPATPEQIERFHKVWGAFDSYTEFSPSGTGVHIVVKGNVPSGVRRDNVEVYSAERYMTFTGHRVLGRMESITEQQQWLDMLYAEMTPVALSAAMPLADRPEVEGDESILQRARSADNGMKFSAHYDADWSVIGHSDHSRADMALLQMLGFYTENDIQLRRLFLASELGQRDKAAKRKDYLDLTIGKVRAIQAQEPNAAHGEQVGQALLAAQDGETISGFALPTPRLRPEAYYGILGEVAEVGSAHTEAVPAALAINTLTRFCATLGRSPYLAIGDDLRSLRPFVLIVGPTSKGRKGTSAALPARIFEHVDILCGLPLRTETSVSSGEGLVWLVRDPKEDAEGKVVDPGVNDKRVLLEISEFAAVLAQAKRETSVLTAVLRDAFDGRKLSTPNKNNPAFATGAHFVVVGHITREELTKLLTATDIANGFANRFMMVYSARQKIVDDPKPTSVEVAHVFAQRIAAAVQTATNRLGSPVELTTAARARWSEIRRELESRPHISAVQSLMARADTYVRILAAAIALINQESIVEPKHLDAALAWVDHWEETANFCFTAAAAYDEMMQSKGMADEIVEAVRKRGGKNVTRSDIYNDLTNRGSQKDRAKVFEKAITALQNEAPPRLLISKVSGKGRPKNLFSLAA